MSERQFAGSEGMLRLKGFIAAIVEVRGTGPGTQEFLLGWVYGLADAGVIDDNAVFAAQQFIAHRVGKDLPLEPIALYLYPSATYQRVEGKGLRVLEEEIMAGGPHAESRVQRIYQLAGDETQALHYVAKHYLFLSRAKHASYR